MNKAGREERKQADGVQGGAAVSLGSAAGRRKPPEYSGIEVICHIQQCKQPDYWPTNGWKTALPEEHGLDSAAIAAALDQAMSCNLHSFVLVRNGYIVAEGYGKEWEADSLHPVYSITKAFTAAACGLAIEDGVVSGVSQKLGDFFPEIRGDRLKANITIEQLLTMSSGLNWDNRGERSSVEMADSPNWVQYVLERSMRFQPGAGFQYNNGNAHVLSGLLQRAIGLPISEYVYRKLLEPMGATKAVWGRDLQGVAIGSWALRLRTRDMAKFGMLYMLGGRWQGEQLLPLSWIQQSVQTRTKPTMKDGSPGAYGYFLWMKPVTMRSSGSTISVFYAAGSGGQRIFVVPQLSLILATTGNNQRNDYMPEQFLDNLLLAVQADEALPANEPASSKLHASVNSFKRVVDKPE